jgi:hypothetical protein
MEFHAELTDILLHARLTAAVPGNVQNIPEAIAQHTLPGHRPKKLSLLKYLEIICPSAGAARAAVKVSLFWDAAS